MDQAEPKASPKLRALLVLGGLVLLALWGWALTPLFERWGDPRADGFHLIPTFWATITAPPLGVIALIGGISGSEKGVRNARTSLMIAGGLAVVVAELEVVRRLSILFD